MTTIQDTENEDLQQFDRLTNYIDVLMDVYPKPITRKELAQKTGVSQAAITKIKGRLLKLCDPNALIFNSKIILRADDTFGKLLGIYFLRMKPTNVLLSNYGWHIIRQMDVHSKIEKQINEYSSHFNKEDTEMIIKIFLYNLKYFQTTSNKKVKIGDPQQMIMLLSTQYAVEIENFTQKLDLPIENIEDLLKILKIRDKLFFFTKQLLLHQIQKASILQELSETEKITYMNVYSKTLDFYLKELFKIGTDFIKQATERRKIQFKEEYDTIGYLYKPSS